MKLNIASMAFRNTILIIAVLVIVVCKKATSNSTNTEPESGNNNTPSIQSGKLVLAEGGLNSRENPELGAKVVFLLPNYYYFAQYEEVGEEIEVKDKKGKWTKIDYEGKTGYVFGGYLTNSKLENSSFNEAITFYYNFYSTPMSGSREATNCIQNYLQQGCLVVVYKASNNQPINVFYATVVNEWIDKDHLAASWSIGDAGYSGDGIKSINIHTKAGIDVWQTDTQMKISEEDTIEERDNVCLKTYCFDRKKNPDVITQIKSTHGLKFFETGQYAGSGNEYSTEIQLGTNDSIIFYPNKNVVVRK